MSFAITKNIIKSRAVASNILAFIAANQAQAILAVNSNVAIKPIKDFSDSVANRNKPVFPSIAFSDDNDATDYSSDILPSAYAATFETVIENQDPNEATRLARIYSAAINLMIANMTNAELIANTGATLAVLTTIETGFLKIKTNDSENDFFQVFETKATFNLIASSYQ